MLPLELQSYLDDISRAEFEIERLEEEIERIKRLIEVNYDNKNN